jgi:hypothetical protein
LIPTGKLVKKYNAQVIAPSITLEHVEHWNLQACMEAVDRWLSYANAWEVIDYFSLHYSKGDTSKGEKHAFPTADNLMPLYDYLYTHWIKAGKISGVWNDEEGFTAMETPLDHSIALEPWECAPYTQWVPRYLLPLIDWGLQHDWNHKDQYKAAWYYIRTDGGREGVFSPNALLEIDAKGKVKASLTGRTMQVLRSQFQQTERVSSVSDDIQIGLSLYHRETLEPGQGSYRFPSYAFQMDESIFATAWLNLPGLEFVTNGSSIQLMLNGINQNTVEQVRVINYESGEIEKEINELRWSNTNILHVEIPRTSSPVLYLQIQFIK